MYSLTRFFCLVLGLYLVYLLIYLRLSRVPIHSKQLKFTYDETYFNKTLKEILIPRWPESWGHFEVIEFLAKELEVLGFVTKRDEFGDSIPFTNIIGIVNPNAEKFIMLTCHFDSKYIEDLEEFVGATDCAVSCAILLNIAKSLNQFLMQEFSSRKDLGLVMAFFDGHESMGGIEDDTYPLLGSINFVEKNIIPRERILVVITLNFIGAPDHIYMSRYERTSVLHDHLVDIEQELSQSGHLSTSHQLFYKLQDLYRDNDDDHIPFLEAGVPVMHIVPHTYTEVWRRIEDNIQHLHWPTVRNMNIILTQFVYRALTK